MLMLWLRLLDLNNETAYLLTDGLIELLSQYCTVRGFAVLTCNKNTFDCVVQDCGNCKQSPRPAVHLQRYWSTADH